MTESLQRRFGKHIETSGLVQRGSRGVVAVSGGIDSVVLLHLFGVVKDSLNLGLGVAHFNHRLRAKESDGDEEFVRVLAREAGLPFYRSSLPPRSSTSHENLEAYARRLRYRFLEEVRKDGDYDWIATGHHADDQAETVLMRVMEGSGIRGLTGIQPRRCQIIRPMLPFTRDQLREYAQARNLTYREDSSNLDRKLERNYVRHELIPRIRRLNPNFAFSISRLSQNIQELDDMIQRLVRERRGSIVMESDSGHTILHAKRLSKEPMIIQKRLIFDLVSLNGSGLPWRHPDWSDLGLFLRQSSTGQICDLPDGWRMLRDRDRFVLERPSEEKLTRKGEEIQFRAENHVFFSLGHHYFAMDILPHPVEFEKDSGTEYADYGRLSEQEMVLRPWRPGDRMKPLGLKGHRKVSDILVDEKISRFEKERQFVLMSGREIVWLCGIRLDDRFKVQNETQPVARLRWRRVSKATP